MKSVLLDQLEKEGYVCCRRFTSVASIAENIERVIRDVVPSMPPEHVFYEDRKQADTLKQLQLLQQHDVFFSELAEAGPFRELAETLLCDSVVCKNIQYFNKPPQTGKATPPHQDGYYFKLAPPHALTMWLALEEVDIENGCVRYIPGSHKQGMRSHAATGTLGFSQGIVDFPTDEDRQKEIALIAAPGDLLVHHALTVHRADANLSQTRSRRAIGFIFYASQAKVDSKAWERYQEELKNELMRDGKI